MSAVDEHRVRIYVVPADCLERAQEAASTVLTAADAAQTPLFLCAHKRPTQLRNFVTLLAQHRRDCHHVGYVVFLELAHHEFTAPAASDVHALLGADRICAAVVIYGAGVSTAIPDVLRRFHYTLLGQLHHSRRQRVAAASRSTAPPPPLSPEITALCRTLELSDEESNDIKAVRRAYRAQALRWHPDKHADAERRECTARFHAAESAYRRLCELRGWTAGEKR